MIRRTTLDDVAQRAGVSGKTVSRVVNGEPNVSARVRDAVLSAIADLDYRPNLAARSLASPKSFIIAALGPPIDNSYYHSVHAHLGAACRTRGYHLVVEQVDVTSVTALDQLRGLLAEVRPRGIVLLPGLTHHPDVTKLLIENAVDWVSFTATNDDACGSVLADETHGEVQLADHLWHLGHRSFAILTGPKGGRSKRGLTFSAHLLEHGVDPSALSLLEIGMTLPGLEAGRQAALTLLESTLPTAVFGYADDVAAGAIGVFLTKGIRVPEDISLVGFDDNEIAKAIFPPLTTIRQPIDIMAHAAIDIVIRGTQAEPTEITCPVELIVRQSTACPPS